MEGFLDLRMLANVAAWEEETKSHQNQNPHSSSPSSSSLGQPKTPRLVFKFRGSDGQKTSFVFGNPPTRTAPPHRKGLFNALVEIAVSALEEEEAKSHQSHKTHHRHWPLLTFCRKQRTTTLPRKPRRLLHQTTMTLSSSDEDEENDPSSVLLLPIKKRKWNKTSSSSEEEEIKENKKKRKITCSRSRPRPLPPQDLSPIEQLPIGLRDKIRELGGDDLKLILYKKLTATDVNKNNNRLSIPVSHSRCPEFLREDEKVELEKRDEKCEKRLKGIQVKVYDQSLREYHRCKLKQWYMGSNPVYNLDTKWYDIVLDNKLAKDDNARLWSFRVQSELCFALAKVSKPNNGTSCMNRG